MKIAIIHHWLVNMRGGEKVLECFCDLYPDADIYTHVLCKELISDKIKKHSIYTTFINKLPWASRFYPYYLPLMPLALEALDVTQYDLIISIESGPAKGIIPSPQALHICYINSPMRYAWDMFHTYWANSHWLKRAFFNLIMHKIRIWDTSSSLRTDHFIANSSFIKKRVQKYYRRSSTVINPPVNIDQFIPISEPTSDYYLWLGEFTAYKRPRDAVIAFNKNKKNLIMAGTGSEKESLQELANNNIQFLDKLEQQKLISLMQNCRALLYTGTEDFGIIPVECMACGRPVIAHQSGGILDTVIDGKTGILYQEMSAQGLNQAINQFEEIEQQFDRQVIRAHSEQFSEEIFKTRFLKEVEKQFEVHNIKSET